MYGKMLKSMEPKALMIKEMKSLYLIEAMVKKYYGLIK